MRLRMHGESKVSQWFIFNYETFKYSCPENFFFPGVLFPFPNFSECLLQFVFHIPSTLRLGTDIIPLPNFADK